MGKKLEELLAKYNTVSNTKLKDNAHYCNVIVLEENVSDEIIEEAKEVLTKSVIDDIKEKGETPISILLSQKQNTCIHVEIWSNKSI